MRCTINLNLKANRQYIEKWHTPALLLTLPIWIPAVWKGGASLTTEFWYMLDALKCFHVASSWFMIGLNNTKCFGTNICWNACSDVAESSPWIGSSTQEWIMLNSNWPPDSLRPWKSIKQIAQKTQKKHNKNPAKNSVMTSATFFFQGSKTTTRIQ